MLFIGEDYYPMGGANDLIATFDNIDEAESYVESLIDKHDTELPDINWWHIFSLSDCRIVKSGTN